VEIFISLKKVAYFQKNFRLYIMGVKKMYYIKGKIVRINDEKVMIEDQNGIAYQGVNVYEKDTGISFKINETNIIYCLQYWNEFEMEYLFFEKENLRNLFAGLLKIKQIGIKTAQSIFQTFNSEEFYDIVKNYDVNELQRIKGLGSLTAKIIIDELNKTLFNQKMTQKQEKILHTLQRLGYKMTSVYKVLKDVDRKLPEDQLLSTSIRMLSQREY
jgi:Holliday junction DNA helicase RuvA